MNIAGFIIFISLTVGSLEQNPTRLHPDIHLSIVELITKYGYVVEVHEVVTDDGYILTLFRIPHGKNDLKVNGKPLLLMHGLFGQAENFVINKRNNGSLAYFLADNGFDVWLGNNRGTQHGLRHKVLDYRKRPFWNFSIDEMGIFDLSSIIDYILNITKKKRLFYAGHSQGGAIYFILASMKPQYQEKITLALMLATGGYENHFKHPLLTSILHDYKTVQELINNLNLFSLLPPYVQARDLVNVCATLLQNTCHIIISTIGMQMEMEESDPTMVPLILEFFPSVSTKQIVHFAQIISSGHFRPFDYGEQKNMDIYGKKLPDDYPLQNIKVPTAFFFSDADRFAFAKDSEEMCEVIQNCVFKHNLKKHKWSHFDIIFGKHIADDLFGPFMEIARKYDVE